MIQYFFLYFIVGVVLYLLFKNRLSKAVDKFLTETDPRYDTMQGCVFPVFFIIFWPVGLFYMVKNNLSKNKNGNL